MDIRELRYVIAIADEGTLTRAADRLHVSRQAATKALRSVEAQAGTRLFERQGQRLVPTERGGALVADARRVVGAFDELCRLHLARPSDLPASGAVPETLSVALVSGGGDDVMGGLVSRYTRLNPRTQLHVEEMSSDAVLAAVAAGNADVGIVGSHPSLLGGFETCCVQAMGVWLLVPADLPLARRDVARAADLDGLPMVTMGEHNHMHRFVMRACARAGVAPRVRATANDASMIERLCAEHHAACFGFPPEVVPPAEGLAAVPVQIEGAEAFGTYLARRPRARGRVPSRAAQRFWNVALAIAAASPRAGVRRS